MAAKRVLTLATEEYVLKLLKELKEDFPEQMFDQLNTDDKTIPGAINEVNDMLGMFTVPEYDVTAQMYYGIVDPKDVGSIHSFKDITFEMIDNDAFISTKPGERSLSIGHVEQGQVILIAIPVIFDLVATKDDGFGGVMAFDESVLGANGVDTVFNGLDYMLYGEFAVIEGERRINITKRAPIESDCKCPPVSDADITDIINGLK